MSYTPFKMTPKGPIMKKMLSASQKSKLPTEVKQGMVDSGEYGGPLNKKGKSPYEYEKNPDELVERKDKEAGVRSKMRKPKKSTKSLHSPLEPDATNDYNNEMKNYKLNSKTPKQRADFNPGYEGADISDAEYKKRLKSGSTKRD
jgi:hypothetical protein